MGEAIFDVGELSCTFSPEVSRESYFNPSSCYLVLDAVIEALCNAVGLVKVGDDGLVFDAFLS